MNYDDKTCLIVNKIFCIQKSMCIAFKHKKKPSLSFAFWKCRKNQNQCTVLQFDASLLLQSLDFQIFLHVIDNAYHLTFAVFANAKPVILPFAMKTEKSQLHFMKSFMNVKQLEFNLWIQSNFIEIVKKWCLNVIGIFR